MATFDLSRSTTIEAAPAKVHALINDFRQWPKWSPWENLDLTREYSGAEQGVGAAYAWAGNKQAGKGSMAITESTPERIVVALSFLKPFKAENTVTFDLTPVGQGTQVTWSMTGQRSGLAQVMGKMMDPMLLKQLSQGLAQLKECAEQEGASHA